MHTYFALALNRYLTPPHYHSYTPQWHSEEYTRCTVTTDCTVQYTDRDKDHGTSAILSPIPSRWASCPLPLTTTDLPLTATDTANLPLHQTTEPGWHLTNDSAMHCAESLPHGKRKYLLPLTDLAAQQAQLSIYSTSYSTVLTPRTQPPGQQPLIQHPSSLVPRPSLQCVGIPFPPAIRLVVCVQCTSTWWQKSKEAVT